MITLVSKDGDKMLFAKAVCEKSVLLKGLLEEEDHDDIPVDVETKELATVMKFCSYIKDNAFPQIAKPLPTADFTENLGGNEWYIDFIQGLEQDEMFAVGLAANLMDIPELNDLIACKIACLCKGKSVAECRTVFGVANDFT